MTSAQTEDIQMHNRRSTALSSPTVPDRVAMAFRTRLASEVRVKRKIRATRRADGALTFEALIPNVYHVVLEPIDAGRWALRDAKTGRVWCVGASPVEVAEGRWDGAAAESPSAPDAPKMDQACPGGAEAPVLLPAFKPMPPATEKAGCAEWEAGSDARDAEAAAAVPKVIIDALVALCEAHRAETTWDAWVADDGTAVVNAQIDGHFGVLLGADEDPEGGAPSGWTIQDCDTGHAIGRGATPLEAIADARRRV